MEAKIIYPVITTLIMLMYLVYTLFNKPKTYMDSFTRKGVTIFIFMFYIITWAIWFFIFKLGL